MSAIVKALIRLRRRRRKLQYAGADEGDIVIENGEVKVAGTDKKLGWHEVCLGAIPHNLPEGMGGLGARPSTLPSRLALTFVRLRWTQKTTELYNL